MEKVKVDVFNKGQNELPIYSTSLSAGFDIRADLTKINSIKDIMGNGKIELVINDNDEKIVKLLPGARVLIPTGLHVAIPDDYELQIRPRSGLAIKNGITVLNSTGTIDSDFRGEIGIILINTDLDTPFEIEQGDRIAQGVLNMVEQVKWYNVDTIEELGDTKRGQGGFGHTGV